MTSRVAPWTEPARRLPLRWGTYTGRYLAGLLFIVGGLLLHIGANTYVVPFLLIGNAVHATGWLIMPGPGARRIAVVFPSLCTLWLLLIGPQILAVLAVPFLGWLFVRERPLRSYVTVLVVIATGVYLSTVFHTAQDEPQALGVAVVVLVASAWLARALATTKRRRVALA